MANIDNIPPQLDHVLPGPALLSVNEMCEMMPGIPWTNQILDDLVDTLRDTNIFQVNNLSPPVGGITAITVGLYHERTRVKGKRKMEISARVFYYCSAQSHRGHENPATKVTIFPLDRTGVKAAIEFLQATVQNIKRRGMCEPCRTLEPPVKRLRVGNSGLCASCLVKKIALE
jgi:hypothetical protein